MDARTAIKRLSNNQGNKDENINALHTEVSTRCKTTTDGSDNGTTLWDWLYEGQYSGNETPTSLAREWDDLSE